MYLEKFQVDKIKNGRLSAIIHLVLTGLILRNIMKTAQDSHTIAIKQIVSFQERMHLEKFQVDKIQNVAFRPLFPSTGLILLNIMKTAQDSYTITNKQIVRFQGRMHFLKNLLDQVQNGRQSAIILFHMAVIW